MNTKYYLEMIEAILEEAMEPVARAIEEAMGNIENQISALSDDAHDDYSEDAFYDAYELLKDDISLAKYELDKARSGLPV